MSKKTGTLIKNARTKAGLTQAQLAKKVDGCTAADIGKAERGEKDLTQTQLKQIAKATGVTQASLINSAKASKPASGKTSSAKTSSAETFKLSNKEKELIRKYRKAGVATQAIIGMILDKTADTSGSGKKDDDNILQTLLNAGSGGGSGKKDDLLGNLINLLGKK